MPPPHSRELPTPNSHKNPPFPFFPPCNVLSSFRPYTSLYTFWDHFNPLPPLPLQGGLLKRVLFLSLIFAVDYNYPDITHIPSTYHPHIIHISSRYHPNIAHISSTYHPHIIHISSTYHPDIIQISSTYHPDIIHISSTYHPDIIHISSTYHPHIIHISSTYHPDITNPIQYPSSSHHHSSIM